jgi:hypothetical protein
MKKPVWATTRPKKTPKKMTTAQKSAAKKFAAKTGTKYPSLVANIHGLRSGKK